MNTKKIFWGLALLLSALTLVSCQSAEVAVPAADLLPAPGIIAQGQVEPASWQDVAFSVAGQVLDVLVMEGDTVQAGQVLARLSGGELRAFELARAEQELLAAQQSLDNLQANAELLQAQSSAAVAAAESALSDAQTGLDDLKNPDPLAVAQLEARIDLLTEQLIPAQEDLQNLEDRTSPDPLDLAEARLKVADLDQALSDARQALDELTSPDALQMAQLEASLPVLTAQLAAAQADADALIDGVDPNLLALAEARLTTAQAALSSAQANSAALELRAPMGGSLVGLKLLPGQVVSAGLPIATVADLSAWLVKTDDLTEIEVVGVQTDATVTILLDALPESPLNGTVAHIAERYEDRRGDVTYTVTIALPEVPAGLRWGMSGQVQFGGGQ